MGVMSKKMRPGDDQNGEEKDFDKETQKALEEIDTTQNEVDALNERASEEIIKRVPKFWLTAFINHPQMSAIIEEDEEDCLQYLNKLEVEEYDDIKSGYRIRLYFDANPYFDNE